jgi:biopolymer transport protein ExbD
MSHGPAGGGHGAQSAEPNLTPLLDLVLQLVMFFMLIANFAMDDQSEKVQLPVATQAKPLAAKDSNLLFLNVDSKGNVLITGRDEPLLDPEKIRGYMKQTARTYPGPGGEQEAYDLTKVIIRADKDATFRDVHKVMTAVKASGYRHLQLRAKLNP